MGEQLLQTKQSSFDSYENHNFLFRLKSDSKIQNSEVQFTKSPYEEKVEVFCNQETQEMELYVTSPYDKIISSVESALEECNYLFESTADPDQLSDCLTPHLFPPYQEVIDIGQTVKQYREKIVGKLRNYTCDDETLQTTEPIEIVMETIQNKEYRVDNHLLRDEAQIFVVHDFITDEECDILMKSAEPRLERAVVVGGDGAPVVSESRKAQQASYNLVSSDDPLWYYFYFFVIYYPYLFIFLFIGIYIIVFLISLIHIQIIIFNLKDKNILQ